jgi:hypothetical protein
LPDFEIVVVDNAADSEVEKMVSVFSIDNHDSANPTLPAITAPVIRTGVWDRGAYEYE